MPAPFTASEYDHSYSDSPDYAHMGLSIYGTQESNIYTQNGTEFDYHLPYDGAQYSALIHDSVPTISEQYYLPEDGSAFESQYLCHSDLVDDGRPSVFSWPVEYFVTPVGTDFISESYRLPSPTNSSTPALMSSATSTSSTDDTSNFFDMQFGAAIGSNSCHQPHFNSRDPGSTSSISDSSPTRSSRRSPIRTPSPSSDSSLNLDHRRRFPCLIAGCSRRFTSQYTLKVHMEAHKPKPKVSFPCTLGCSERFSRQHDRLRHEVAKHGKVCEFSCEECGRFFSTSKTLGNHRCPVAQGTRWVNT
ncbi:hypothetical protein J3R30DRAFT_3451225 [Lentinula aciculospora]|uniref:C2H2-type domain-containing protein n=1 Tax=Lentinula aciculospora TaxID=153920 RepID=A0A9W9DTJ7_9AGAR|nr:hypothetical protein J3R30DRAFT_3451225 [Lentinula aciculospora]